MCCKVVFFILPDDNYFEIEFIQPLTKTYSLNLRIVLHHCILYVATLKMSCLLGNFLLYLLTKCNSWLYYEHHNSDGERFVEITIARKQKQPTIAT